MVPEGRSLRVGRGSRDDEIFKSRAIPQGCWYGEGFVGEVAHIHAKPLGTRLTLTPCPSSQLPRGVGPVLRHHHTAQFAAVPGGRQDGRASGRRAAEDGAPAQQEQPQVPGHHHGLPAAAGLWQPGEQGVLRPAPSPASQSARAQSAQHQLLAPSPYPFPVKYEYTQLDIFHRRTEYFEDKEKEKSHCPHATTAISICFPQGHPVGSFVRGCSHGKCTTLHLFSAYF